MILTRQQGVTFECDRRFPAIGAGVGAHNSFACRFCVGAELAEAVDDAQARILG
jgi:hypothetical protein